MVFSTPRGPPPDIPNRTKPIFIAGGYWCDVWRVENIHDDSFRAIAVPCLTSLAQAQARGRGITEEELLGKMTLGGYAQSLTHLLWRERGRDKRGVNYVEYEYVRDTVGNMLQKGPLPLEDVLYISREVAAGLGELHTLPRFIHQDLSPDNIGYASGGLVKLLDYGAATLLDSQNPQRVNIGCISTRAPEAFREPATTASDVWSWAAFTYFIRTGKGLFHDELEYCSNIDEQVAWMQSLTKRQAERIVRRKVREVFSSHFRTVLLNALRHDPAQRYPDGKALSVALHERQKRRSPWLAAATLAGATIYLTLALQSSENVPPADIISMDEHISLPATKLVSDLYPGDSYAAVAKSIGERTKTPLEAKLMRAYDLAARHLFLIPIGTPEKGGIYPAFDKRFLFDPDSPASMHEDYGLDRERNYYTTPQFAHYLSATKEQLNAPVQIIPDTNDSDQRIEIVLANIRAAIAYERQRSPNVMDVENIMVHARLGTDAMQHIEAVATYVHDPAWPLSSLREIKKPETSPPMTAYFAVRNGRAPAIQEPQKAFLMHWRAYFAAGSLP